MKGKRTSRLDMLDNTHLQERLELIFASLQKPKSLDHTKIQRMFVGQRD